MTSQPPDNATAGAPVAAEHAAAIYRAALDAVRADRLTLAALQVDGDVLRAGEYGFDLRVFEHVYVVGAGKAAAGMVAAVEERLGDRIDAGVVATKYGHGGPTRRIRMLEAGHPVPDDNSVVAGLAIAEMARQAGPRDLVLVVLSGGASAIMELPREGISLVDLRAVTDGLLKSGAPIEELNAVRACLSQLKAGGLTRIADPATVLCLVLSDVLGNPLDVIASGPCLPSPLDPAAARTVLERRGLWETAPQAVRRTIDGLASRPQPKVRGCALHVLVGDIWSALGAAEQAARDRGLHPCVLTGWLQGEAREVARVLAGVARDLPRLRTTHGFDCVIAGGETTVTVRGGGQGGRSQEIAAVAAGLLDGQADVALLAAGTDGTDGPTDAAGGLVDGGTLAKASAAGQSLERALRESNTYPFLDAAGALLRTGPTYSNVGDLVIITAHEEPVGEPVQTATS